MRTVTPSEASLTDVEQRLVDSVTRGDTLDLAGGEPVDEAAMRTWGSSRTIRAIVVRDILRGRLAPAPDPHGLRLRGARITGRLDLENMTTEVGAEFFDCLLSEGLVARDAKLPFLTLAGCRLEHPTQPPLDAQRLTVATLILDRAVIIAYCRDAAVRLLGARIYGQLSCRNAMLRNDSGPAFQAENLQLDENLFLNHSEAIGAGVAEVIRLFGARLGGLECIGTRVCNDAGPALIADRLQVDWDVLLRRFDAAGAGDMGVVRLAGAHIHGQLDFTEATIRNNAGIALDAEALQVDGNLFLNRFEAIGAGSTVALNLIEVRIGGMLVFAPTRLEHTTDTHAWLALDGLTYTGLPIGISSSDWLTLLREHTPSYAAQPYQQFAGVHRAAGDDSAVRTILMAQRQDQIDRGVLSGRTERAWVRLTGLTLGYGYQPWRALVFLIVVATIAVVLAVVLGAHGGVARVDPKPPTAVRCSTVERVGVGLDLGLPLIKTGVRDHCDTTTSTTGQVLTVAGWGLQLLAWAFATLFVAGFTGAVRKT